MSPHPNPHDPAAPEVRIDPEFQGLAPPLSADELARLERRLLAEGCLDPLLVWREENILLDGHNRHALCRKHGLPYRVEFMSLPDRAAARAAVLECQLGRRNLTPEGLSYLRGRQYRACRHQGRPAQANGMSGAEPAADQTDHRRSTAARLAAAYQVGEATVRRDARFAAAVDRVAAVCGDQARRLILSRDARPTRRQAEDLSLLGDDELRQRFAEWCQAGRRRGPAGDDDPVRLSVPAEPAALARVLVRRLGQERALAACRALAGELHDHGVPVEVYCGPAGEVR
jgi:hypothetical protein